MLSISLYLQVYPDDIAPPKLITRKNNGNERKTKVQANELEENARNKQSEHKQNRLKSKEKIEIIQKSLARALVRCRSVHTKRIGVEILEASVYDLNPHNMRRTYQIGSYRYDPGKYQGRSNNSIGHSNQDMVQRRMSINSGLGKVGSEVAIIKSNSSIAGLTKDESEEKAEIGFGGGQTTVQYEEKTVLAEDEDEVDAPWNQYAWIEEMQIRVSVSFLFQSHQKSLSNVFQDIWRYSLWSKC